MKNRKLPDLYSDLRNEKGLSQTELANKLNCNKQLISKLESGERTLSMTMLKAYADFFNVSTDYLLGLTNNKTTDANLQAACEYTGLSEEAIVNIKKHCFIPKDIENIDYDKSFHVQYFTPFYYEANQYVINNVLSNTNFWNIVFHLYSLMHFSNALLAERQNINQILMKWIGSGISENKELEEYYNRCNSADVCRYSIIHEIEKICDLFDSRAGKEATDNGEHNPTNE